MDGDGDGKRVESKVRGEAAAETLSSSVEMLIRSGIHARHVPANILR